MMINSINKQGWVNTILAFLIGFSGLFLSNSYAAGDSGYYYDSAPLPSQTSWMKSLPDGLNTGRVSMPGTHDSGTYPGYGGSIAQTQTLSIENQLNAGVRYLDIRLKSDNGRLYIYHGPISQDLLFKDVVSVVTSFLKKNPSEFIFMRIDEESGSAATFAKEVETIQAAYASYFYKTTDSISFPSVGAARGKVIALYHYPAQSNPIFGIPFGLLDKQDEYSIATIDGLYSKWTKVKDYFVSTNKTPKIKVGFINHLSASGGGFPYFVASGRSSPEMSAPQLLTGVVEMSNSTTKVYQDFPRVSCAGLLCSIAYQGTNVLAANWLKVNKPTFVGIVAADFPGSALIDEVIAANWSK